MSSRSENKIKYDREYESTKRGKKIAEIKLCPSDDTELWGKIINKLTSKHGNFKNAVYVLGKRELKK